MGQLVELILEAQSLADAKALLADIMATAEGIRGWDIDGQASSGEMSPELLSEMTSCMVIRLASAKLPDVGVVANVGVRVLQVDGQFDVEINLDLDDVAHPTKLCSGLYQFALDLAQRHGVKSYFAGLEPSSDEDTRFFTGTDLGPFRFPGSS